MAKLSRYSCLYLRSCIQGVLIKKILLLFNFIAFHRWRCNRINFVTSIFGMNKTVWTSYLENINNFSVNYSNLTQFLNGKLFDFIKLALLLTKWIPIRLRHDELYKAWFHMKIVTLSIVNNLRILMWIWEDWQSWCDLIESIFWLRFWTGDSRNILSMKIIFSIFHTVEFDL